MSQSICRYRFGPSALYTNIDVNLQCGPEYSVVVFVLHIIIRVRMLSVPYNGFHSILINRAFWTWSAILILVLTDYADNAQFWYKHNGKMGRALSTKVCSRAGLFLCYTVSAQYCVCSKGSTALIFKGQHKPCFLFEVKPFITNDRYTMINENCLLIQFHLSVLACLECVEESVHINMNMYV